MKIQLKTLAAAAALITVIISAPAIYADETSKSPGTMMGQGGMMQGGQAGQMGQMMATCDQMMQAMMQNHGSPMPSDKSPDGGPDSKKGG